jgi:isopentenyldiphosphate isomerase
LSGKPLVQIVDVNDNLIGHKPRHEIDYTKDIYRSACIWIEDLQGKVLLAQRSHAKDKDPGLWGPAAAGTVDQGETYESNAYKELEEEIGLTGVTLTTKAKIWVGLPRKQFIQSFKGVCDWPVEKFVLQAEEVEAVKWISKHDLVQDVKANPNKYIPSMTEWIKLFINSLIN